MDTTLLFFPQYYGQTQGFCTELYCQSAGIISMHRYTWLKYFLIVLIGKESFRGCSIGISELHSRNNIHQIWHLSHCVEVASWKTGSERWMWIRGWDLEMYDEEYHVCLIWIFKYCHLLSFIIYFQQKVVSISSLFFKLSLFQSSPILLKCPSMEKWKLLPPDSGKFCNTRNHASLSCI